MHTPGFPAFRARLAALGRRTTQNLRQTPRAQLQPHRRDFLPAPRLSSEEDGPNSRDRVFSLRLTFECFVWQLLKPETSCREGVRQVQTLLRLQGRAPVDESDPAYIQARQRLPKERLQKALSATAQAADGRLGSTGQLRGRPVKVVAGSTIPLPDPSRNQKRYPQPTRQKPGCGFPGIRFVALLSLNSGAILPVVWDRLHSHDLRRFRRLWQSLGIGDILLGDRAFGEYSPLAPLPRQGLDGVARLHHQRKVDFRKAKRPAKDDGLFVWTKGYEPSGLSTARQGQQMPAQILVRLLRFTAAIRGFRHRRVTRVTTLLDPQLHPAQQIIALYGRRWSLELCFRDLKTTRGMEALRCQSPEMAEKELLTCLVAHNLIRCGMAEAVARYQVPLERISFKGSLDALRQYSAAMAQARSKKLRRQLWEDLLFNRARDLVPLRPNRREPRAVKHRPKAYPLLNQPRRRFIEISHRSRYWKDRPRNYRDLN